MSILAKAKSIQKATETCLCIGLDTDVEKLPKGFEHSLSAMVDFNKQIIDATKDLCSSYKINFAFYEQFGAEAWDAIAKTLDAIPSTHITIADAKRGDIGNTSAAYAKAVFSALNFDSITVSPYMGFDSVEPFLEYDNKLVFVLALTSNAGSRDFQHLEIDGKPLYRKVIETSQEWKSKGTLGYVVGATHPQELAQVREWIPNAPLLIPGVGTQGGSAEETMNSNGKGLAMVNVSRAIIYASQESDFADKAREAAMLFSRQLRIDPFTSF